ncbi:unnamed protein product [Arctia plantaginis]|uniref:Sulfotransferase domain-containing protein n=1 Tax=Arctia plantaginis TaxID=874455 RepID=A0A8S0ZPH7_ARCPL|nr:unnamed protein product [Arctia plantaginis]
MGEQKYLQFPYEINDVTPEEQEQIDKVFGSIVNVYRLSRFGPRGYMLYEPYKKDAANIYNMPLRPTDVFVTSYQRSGTTMTQELVWLIQNNLDYSKAARVPLTERYFFLEFFMFFVGNQLDAFIRSIDSHLNENTLKEIYTVCAQPISKMLAEIPVSTPRFIKTHVPLSLLNPKLLDTAKVVYVARDPRDVAVSCYHCAKLFKTIRFPYGFKEFWNLFYKNMFVYCPVFEHVKEAWEKRHHPNMLFMFYENISKDLSGFVCRVADFLGKSLSPLETARLCEHLSFENFKNNKSVNQEELRNNGMLDNNELFIRKGMSGGWRDYFDEEMTEQAERWITDNLRDTDLRYPHMETTL